MYLLLMQPPAGVDPGEGNVRTGTTSCHQAGASVNDLVRVGSNTAHKNMKNTLVRAFFPNLLISNHGHSFRARPTPFLMLPEGYRRVPC